MKRINPLLDLTQRTTETIEEMTKHTQQAADRMFNTCDEVRDKINKATECTTNDLSSTIESVKGDMNRIVKELHTATTRTENQDESQKHAKGTGTMYADALNRQFPTSHAGTLARSCARNRQVLVDKAPDTMDN